MGIRIHPRSMFKCTARTWFVHRFSQPVRSLRSRNSRNFFGGNHESWTTDKENPASHPKQNSRITAGFFLYSRITRSISAESRITQNPFQTLLKYNYNLMVLRVYKLFSVSYNVYSALSICNIYASICKR